MKQQLTYLALGDSYTIGELVTAGENFPNQVCSILNQHGYSMSPPRIIATTGWTTGELKLGIKAANAEAPLLKTYDFVSLLIGVNNQYRGYLQKEYSIDFESLLKDALKFAANNKNRIVVLSIPDWGVTPFAKDRNRKLISNEIDDYNKINETITQKMGIQYIYITDWTREAATDLSLLTTDGLHPSGKEYKRWAEKVADYFLLQFNTK